MSTCITRVRCSKDRNGYQDAVSLWILWVPGRKLCKCSLEWSDQSFMSFACDECQALLRKGMWSRLSFYNDSTFIVSEQKQGTSNWKLTPINTGRPFLSGSHSSFLLSSKRTEQPAVFIYRIKQDAYCTFNPRLRYSNLHLIKMLRTRTNPSTSVKTYTLRQ
jgi:hypothetical protein